MTQGEIIELARQADIDHHKLWNDDGTNRLEAFAKLVAAKERSKMQKGYAGVTLWVGNACVTQLVSEALIEHEIKRGLSLEYAANKCLEMYRQARGEA